MPAGLLSTEVYASQDEGGGACFPLFVPLFFFSLSFFCWFTSKRQHPSALQFTRRMGSPAPLQPTGQQTPMSWWCAHCKHTSATVSIRQHTPAYVSIREGSGPPRCGGARNAPQVSVFVKGLLVKQANREPDGCPTPNDDRMRALMCENVYCCTSKVLVPWIKSTNTDTWWLPHAE